MSKIYNYRFVAQIVLEATTPLKTASGKSDFFVDAPVLKDWNGLPMILGTSIAGVLRHSFDEDFQKEIFGYSENKTNEGIGSRILVSNAHLLDENQEIHYSLGIKDETDFLKKYKNLPIREHTAINDKGVAKKHSKFDEEVVFAGSRFKFELEFLGDKEEDEEVWQELLDRLKSPLFRLGGGSTKGFGEMKVESCLESSYIIGKNYQDKPSNLNKSIGEEKKLKNRDNVCIYKIVIKPDNFFSFGAGFGDDEVDNEVDDEVDDIAVTEEIVEWKNNKGKFTEKQILLPASSLKGAISHRVAFHYNRLERVYADKIEIEEFDNYIGENNEAVKFIFGHKKEKDKKDNEIGQKGKALFSDMFNSFSKDEVKIFDHVKIDRFTGGAIDSALYNEKVMANRKSWNIKIILAKEIEDEKIKKAFENTLDDLCNGLLPLGGKVNRGHGIFEGNWTKEGCDDKE